MRVFMSWSGERSRQVAELLKWWTRSVIQASRPWISTEDIDRGALWFSEINNGLNETAVGIVCLTKENKDRPWILFEAGALAKGLTNTRVCTFLVDLEPKDIKDPLAQFNHTFASEVEMRKLATTLNRGLGINALEPDVIVDACKAYWTDFKTRFDLIIANTDDVIPAVIRPQEDIMSEILEQVRSLNQRMRNLENSPAEPRKIFQLGSVEERTALNAMERMIKVWRDAGVPRDEIINRIGPGISSNALRAIMNSIYHQSENPDIMQRPAAEVFGNQTPINKE